MEASTKKRTSFSLLIIMITLMFTLNHINAVVIQAPGVGWTCFKFLQANGDFYNLEGLKLVKESLSYNAKLDTTHVGTSGQVFFNVCGEPTHSDLCSKGQKEIGYVIAKDQQGKDACYLLSQVSSDAQYTTTWTFLPLPVEAKKRFEQLIKAYAPRFLSSQLLTEDKSEIGNVFEDKKNDDKKDDIKKDDPPKDKPKPDQGIEVYGNNTGIFEYNLQMNLHCNKNVTDTPSGVSASYDWAAKLYTVNLTHKDACGYDSDSFFDQLGVWKFVIGGVLSAICLVMVFYGMKLWKWSLGLIGFLAGSMVAYFLLHVFWTNFDSTYKVWIMIGLSLLLGIAVCYLLVTMEKLSLFGAGAFLGVVLGLQLYNLVLYKLDNGGGNMWLWISTIVLALVFAALALVFHDAILIFATAFGGSYVSVKLVGSMIGNYPNETQIAADIEHGKFENLPVMGYVYLGLSLVLAITGIIFQFCTKQKREKPEEEADGDDYANNYYRDMK